MCHLLDRVKEMGIVKIINGYVADLDEYDYGFPYNIIEQTHPHPYEWLNNTVYRFRLDNGIRVDVWRPKHTKHRLSLEWWNDKYRSSIYFNSKLDIEHYLKYLNSREE